MLLTDFIHKLKRLNNRLFVKEEQSCKIGFEEFKNTGLFYKDSHGDHKFLMAIPRNEIPEYSIAAVDFDSMMKYGESDRVKEIERTGYALEEEKILQRGWRIIVGSLIKQGYLDYNKTKRVFNTYFEINRSQLPRNYINRKF